VCILPVRRDEDGPACDAVFGQECPHTSPGEWIDCRGRLVQQYDRRVSNDRDCSVQPPRVTDTNGRTAVISTIRNTWILFDNTNT